MENRIEVNYARLGDDTVREDGRIDSINKNGKGRFTKWIVLATLLGTLAVIAFIEWIGPIFMSKVHRL